MTPIASNWSKWPTHVLLFIAAIVFCLATCVLTVFSFQSGNLEEGVFRIFAFSQRSAGSGSGFKVSDPGFIVTNFHVVDGSQRIKVAYLREGNPVAVGATLVWYSRDKDLAILQTRDPLPGPSVKIADIDRNHPEKLQNVYAVGFPGVADRLARAINDGTHNAIDAMRNRLDPTISKGTIQRLVSSPQRLTIQHSSNINPGNSGGPLFDSCERVVGVNTLAAVSTFSINDLTSAIARNRRVQVTNPGEMEFAVHSREVIAGLDERNIPYFTLRGDCIAGLDQSETFAIVIGILITILCVIAGFNFRLKQDAVIAVTAGVETPRAVLNPALDKKHLIAPSPIPPNSGQSATYALGVQNALVDLKSGASFDLQALFAAKGRISIGRSSEQSDIVIDDPSLSRCHAQIWQDDQGVWMQDVGSTNGTSVDGLEVSKGNKAKMPDRTVITLGTRQLIIESTSAPNISSIEDQASEWMLSGFGHSGQTIQHELFVRGLNRNQNGFISICSIGRDDSNNLVLIDDAVSRHHAEIGVDETGSLLMRDLGSANGTFADDIAISTTPTLIDHAKTIRIGTIQLNLTKHF